MVDIFEIVYWMKNHKKSYHERKKKNYKMKRYTLFGMSFIFAAVVWLKWLEITANDPWKFKSAIKQAEKQNYQWNKSIRAGNRRAKNA